MDTNTFITEENREKLENAKKSNSVEVSPFIQICHCSAIEQLFDINHNRSDNLWKTMLMFLSMLVCFSWTFQSTLLTKSIIATTSSRTIMAMESSLLFIEKMDTPTAIPTTMYIRKALSIRRSRLNSKP